MSVPSDAVWELRNTVGSINYGGGYSVSLSNVGVSVDYSQQALPQLTHNDGVGTSTTTFTSTLGGFTSQMQGNCIHINGQGDFFITAVGSSTSVTLDRATGTFSGATYAVGGCKQLSAAVATVLPSQVAGNKVWIKVDGTYGFNIIPTTTGTALLPVVFEGYGVLRGDGARPTIQCTGPLSNNISTIGLGAHSIVKSFLLDGNGAANPVVSIIGDGAWLYNCICQNANAVVLNVSAVGNGTAVVVERCIVQKSVANSVVVVQVSGSGILMRDTKIVGTGTANGWVCMAILNTAADIVCEDCVFTNAQFEGVYLDTSDTSVRAVFNNCAFWNNGRDGLRNYTSSEPASILTVRNCIFGKNAGSDINYQGGTNLTSVPSIQDWVNLSFNNNFFYTTGTGRYLNLPSSSSDQILPGDPFIDSVATLNFGLKTNTSAAQAIIAGPLRPVWADGINQGSFIAGPMGSSVVAPSLLVPKAAAPVIDEILFPTDISKGATGGPSFNTIVVAAGNGTEQRLPEWSIPRYKWTINAGDKDPTAYATIFNFWVNRQGKARGFRFQDWNDYQATASVLIPDGTPVTQLIKTYGDGLLSYVRNIYKPVAGITMTLNSNPYTAFTLDTTTGLITHTASILKSITAISQATSAVITVGSGHGFTAGDTVYITGVVGMTQINGLTGLVASTTSTTITVNINSVGFNAYVSAGSCGKYVQPGDILAWTGTFDVPVRFDVDEMALVQEDVLARHWDNIPIIEIRGNN